MEGSPNGSKMVWLKGYLRDWIRNERYGHEREKWEGVECRLRLRHAPQRTLQVMGERLSELLEEFGDPGAEGLRYLIWELQDSALTADDLAWAQQSPVIRRMKDALGYEEDETHLSCSDQNGVSKYDFDSTAESTERALAWIDRQKRICGRDWWKFHVGSPIPLTYWPPDSRLREPACRMQMRILNPPPIPRD
jgi:hypothetical protein